MDAATSLPTENELLDKMRAVGYLPASSASESTPPAEAVPEKAPPKADGPETNFGTMPAAPSTAEVSPAPEHAPTETELLDKMKQMGLVQQPVGSDPYFRGVQEPKPRPGIGEQFGNDVSRGFSQLKNIGYGLGAWGADALGYEDYADQLLKTYIDREEQLAKENPAVIGSLENIHDAGDFGRFVVEKLGENVATMIPGLVTGGVGGIVAKRAAVSAAEKLIQDTIAKGFTKEVAEKAAANFINQQIAKGAFGSALASSVPMETGSIYADTFKETGVKSPLIALALGVPAGALDAIEPGLAAKGLLGNTGKGFARTVAENMLTEGGTEGAQEYLEKAGATAADGRPLFTRENFMGALNAAAAGAIGGGAVGGSAHVAGKIFNGDGPDPAQQAALNTQNQQVSGSVQVAPRNIQQAFQNLQNPAPPPPASPPPAPMAPTVPPNVAQAVQNAAAASPGTGAPARPAPAVPTAPVPPAGASPAPDGQPTVSETPETIDAQFTQLLDRKRSAVVLNEADMAQLGITPDDLENVYGLDMVEIAGQGAVVFDPEQHTADDIVTALNENRLNDLLGYVQSKEEAGPDAPVVRATSPEGVVTDTAAVSPDLVDEQADIFQERQPDATLDVTTAEDAIAQRQQQNQQPRGPSADVVAAAKARQAERLAAENDRLAANVAPAAPAPKAPARRRRATPKAFAAWLKQRGTTPEQLESDLKSLYLEAGPNPAEWDADYRQAIEEKERLSDEFYGAQPMNDATRQRVAEAYFARAAAENSAQAPAGPQDFVDETELAWDANEGPEREAEPAAPPAAATATPKAAEALQPRNKRERKRARKTPEQQASEDTRKKEAQEIARDIAEAAERRKAKRRAALAEKLKAGVAPQTASTQTNVATAPTTEPAPAPKSEKRGAIGAYDYARAEKHAVAANETLAPLQEETPSKDDTSGEGHKARKGKGGAKVKNAEAERDTRIEKAFADHPPTKAEEHVEQKDAFRKTDGGGRFIRTRGQAQAVVTRFKKMLRAAGKLPGTVHETMTGFTYHLKNVEWAVEQFNNPKVSQNDKFLALNEILADEIAARNGDFGPAKSRRKGLRARESQLAEGTDAAAIEPDYAKLENALGRPPTGLEKTRYAFYEEMILNRLEENIRAGVETDLDELAQFAQDVDPQFAKMFPVGAKREVRDALNENVPKKPAPGIKKVPRDEKPAANNEARKVELTEEQKAAALASLATDQARREAAYSPLAQSGFERTEAPRPTAKEDIPSWERNETSTKSTPEQRLEALEKEIKATDHQLAKLLSGREFEAAKEVGAQLEALKREAAQLRRRITKAPAVPSNDGNLFGASQSALTQVETPEWAQAHARDTGGDIVWHEGDLALVRGFSILTGQPVYAAAKGTSRTRVDIQSFTGAGFTPEEKAKLLVARAEAVAEDEAAFVANPEGPFTDGKRFAASPGMPKELIGYTRDLLRMLGINARVYLTTVEDARNGERFAGPYAPINSAGLDPNEKGSTRRLANGDHYISLSVNRYSPTANLEALAHEIGHILEKEEFAKADQQTKNEIISAYNAWLAASKSSTAEEHVHNLRGYTSAKNVNFVANTASMPAEKLTPYWRSFNEWFADQVSRWAMSSEKPQTLVDKFFARIGQALRRLYATVTGQKYLPSSQMAKWLDARSPADFTGAFTPSGGLSEAQSMRNVTNDVTPTVSERASSVWDNAKRFGLKMSFLDHIARSNEGLFVDAKGNDVLSKLVEIAQRKDGMQERLQEEYFDPVAQGWATLQEKNYEDAGEAAEIIQDANIFDAQVGKGANNDYLKKPGLRNVQGRTMAGSLQSRYGRLSPEAQNLIDDTLALFRRVQNEHVRAAIKNRLADAGITPPNMSAFLKRAVEGNMTPADKALFAGHDRVLKNVEAIRKARVIRGDYAPLVRFGQYGVITYSKIADPMGGREIAPGQFEFRARTMKGARAQAEAFIAEMAKQGLPFLKAKQEPVTKGATDFAIVVSIQRRGFYTFDSRAEAKAWLRENGGKFEKASPVQELRDTGMPSSDLTVAQRNSILQSIRNNPHITSDMKTAAEELFTEATAGLMSGNRIQHRHIARRKVLGASTDYARILYQYGRSAAGTLANLRFRPEMNEALDVMAKSTDNNYGPDADRKVAVYKEIKSRGLDGDANISEPSRWVQNALAATYLSKLFYPLYSVLQGMQPGMVTWPSLSEKFGPVRSAAALHRAFNDVGGIKTVLAGVKNTGKAVSQFNRIKIDSTDTFKSVRANIARASDGALLVKVLDELKERGMMGEGSFDIGFSISSGAGPWGRAWEKVQRIARQAPKAIEDINRAQTAVAAFRLAMSRPGMTVEKATKYAIDEVLKTQGLYRSANQPMPFKGPVLRPFAVFKNYALMMTHLIADMSKRAFAGATPQEKREAMRGLMTLGAVQIAMAGALSLPGLELIKLPVILAASLGLSDGWDEWEEKFRKFSENNLGKDLGTILTKGLPHELGISLSSHLSLSDMWVHGQPDKNSMGSLFEFVLSNFLGAPGGTVKDALEGIDDITKNGDYLKGMGKILPIKFLANALKAADRYNRGQATEAEVGLNIFGLRSSRQDDRGREIGGSVRRRDALESEQKSLQNRYLSADTPAERARIRVEMIKHNSKSPLKYKVFPTTMEKRRLQNERERVN